MHIAGRMFAVAIAAAAVAAVSPPLAAQQIALTDKITRLEGTSGRVPEKGWGEICGVPVSNGNAGWLAITTIRQRPGGFANVMREVYILNTNGDEPCAPDESPTIRPFFSGSAARSPF
jgi:hypothetical protein